MKWVFVLLVAEASILDMVNTTYVAGTCPRECQKDCDARMVQVGSKRVTKNGCYRRKLNCVHCAEKRLQERFAKADVILDKLDKMLGLEKVKAKMHELVSLMRWQMLRKKEGVGNVGAMSLHMAFLGNPGTGKTVVARIAGELLSALGLLSSKKNVPFEEVSRGDLVAARVGGTAPKTTAAFEKAIGGVLFVDEAYSLVRDSRDNFGQEAVDTLIQLMENNRGKVVVILAGYEAQTERFLDSNPGFQSRVAEKFHFDDYTCPQLLGISDLMMSQKRMQTNFEHGCAEDSSSPGCQALRRVVTLRTECCETLEDCPDLNQVEDNGNGRTVRNILESSYRSSASRVLGNFGPDVLAEAHAREPTKCGEAAASLSSLTQAGTHFTDLADVDEAAPGADVRCEFQLLVPSDLVGGVEAAFLPARQACPHVAWGNWAEVDPKKLGRLTRTKDCAALGTFLGSSVPVDELPELTLPASPQLALAMKDERQSMVRRDVAELSSLVERTTPRTPRTPRVQRKTFWLDDIDALVTPERAQHAGPAMSRRSSDHALVECAACMHMVDQARTSGDVDSAVHQTLRVCRDRDTLAAKLNDMDNSFRKVYPASQSVCQGSVAFLSSSLRQQQSVWLNNRPAFTCSLWVRTPAFACQRELDDVSIDLSEPGSPRGQRRGVAVEKFADLRELSALQNIDKLKNLVKANGIEWDEEAGMDLLRNFITVEAAAKVYLSQGVAELEAEHGAMTMMKNKWALDVQAEQAQLEKEKSDIQRLDAEIKRMEAFAERSKPATNVLNVPELTRTIPIAERSQWQGVLDDADEEPSTGPADRPPWRGVLDDSDEGPSVRAKHSVQPKSRPGRRAYQTEQKRVRKQPMRHTEARRARKRTGTGWNQSTTVVRRAGVQKEIEERKRKARDRRDKLAARAAARARAEAEKEELVHLPKRNRTNPNRRVGFLPADRKTNNNRRVAADRKTNNNRRAPADRKTNNNRRVYKKPWAQRRSTPKYTPTTLEDRPGATPQVEAAMAELRGLIGLADVKAQVEELRVMVEFDYWRKKLLCLKSTKQQKEEHAQCEMDASLLGQSLHMKFLGNPGTGKTVVARIVGKILSGLGLLKSPTDEPIFEEVDRSRLVGDKKGKTAIKTKEAVAQAMGGVLFIDEAYSLVNGPRDVFGHEAVDTLIAQMENNHANLIVILAGYSNEMEAFVNSNPGFKSRIPITLQFADYSCEQLKDVGLYMLKRQDVRLARGAEEALQQAIQLQSRCDAPQTAGRDNRDAGNGRTVRNVLEAAYRALAYRLGQTHEREMQQAAKGKLDGSAKEALSAALSTLQPEDFGPGMAQFASHALVDKVQIQRADTPPEDAKGIANLDEALAQLKRVETLAAAGDFVAAAEKLRGAKVELGKLLGTVGKSEFEVAGRVFSGIESTFHEAEIANGWHSRVPAGLLDTESPVGQAYAQLAKLVGMDAVKARVSELYISALLTQARKGVELPRMAGQSYHMAFLGNPGTGKTVVARVLGRLLGAIGVVTPPDPEAGTGCPPPAPDGEEETESDDMPFIEASRAQLVGEYHGHTAIKVQGEVCKAMGGVLFIDEAYSIVQQQGDSFGQEAVSTLIKAMEDQREHVIVILAGYDQEMAEFLAANPGFKSRVPTQFNFADYKCPELMQIGKFQYAARKLDLAPDAEKLFESTVQFVTGCCDGDGPCETERGNGNGRAVRNVMESSMKAVAARVVGAENPEDISTVLPADMTPVLDGVARTLLEPACRPHGSLSRLSQELAGGSSLDEVRPAKIKTLLRQIKRLSTIEQAGGLREACNSAVEEFRKALNARLGRCNVDWAHGVAKGLENQGRRLREAFSEAQDEMSAVKTTVDLARASRGLLEPLEDTKTCTDAVRELLQLPVNAHVEDLARLAEL